MSIGHELADCLLEQPKRCGTPVWCLVWSPPGHLSAPDLTLPGSRFSCAARVPHPLCKHL